jgi:hypothetical protein
LVLLVLLLPGAVQTHVASQRQIRDPIGLLREYRDLVEAYRRRGVDGIQAELTAWDATRIHDAIYPAGVSPEGSHRLEVKVKGRRAIVRARRGYVVS